MKSRLALFLIAGLLIAPSAYSMPTPAALPGEPVSTHAFVYRTVSFYGWQFSPLTNTYVTALEFNEFRRNAPAPEYPV
jgi:hypothetical protein